MTQNLLPTPEPVSDCDYDFALYNQASLTLWLMQQINGPFVYIYVYIYK